MTKQDINKQTAKQRWFSKRQVVNTCVFGCECECVVELLFRIRFLLDVTD